MRHRVNDTESEHGTKILANVNIERVREIEHVRER